MDVPYYDTMYIPSKHSSIEQELKFSLTKHDYQKLLRVVRCHILKTHYFINYYFDTPSQYLWKKRIGLRLRVGSKRAFLTVKFPKKGGASIRGLHSRYEYEQKIPVKTAERMLANRVCWTAIHATPVKILGKSVPTEQLEQIRKLGSLKTRRTLAKLGRDLVMEIDRCKLFGKEFFELEVETNNPNKALQEIRKFLLAHKVPVIAKNQSKLSGFMRLWVQKGSFRAKGRSDAPNLIHARTAASIRR